MRGRRIVLVATAVMAVVAFGCNKKKQAATEGQPAKAAEPKVTVDLHIMSKCPFGVQAVQQLKPGVDAFNGEVAMKLHFIGQKGADGKLSSMHGDAEVQGDIDMLCAEKIGDAAAYWKYMDCVLKEWRKIPEKDAECAKQAGIDAAKFKACSEGDEGKKLLEASFEVSKKAGASGSPTIVVGGERYMGARSAQALELTICNKFGESKKLAHCKDVEPPPEVKLTVITDKRCGPKCDPNRMIQSLKSIFMNLKPTVLDWVENPEAQEIAKKANITKLPALFFDKSVEGDKAGFERMQRWLTKADPYYVVKVRAEWDPTAEICDDGKDNTGNGKVDCADETCANTLACRPETKKNLEVFVMSQCPFGAMGVLAMGEVLDAFGKDINFDIHFIGDVNGDNISSMHGPAEVEEDKRWVCAKKHFPKDYLKYVWCRAQDYRNPDWKKCATGPIKADVLEKCFTGDEGTQLLKADMQIAKDLGIGASPTWVVNGRTKFSGVTAKAIQDNYCKANPGLKGCEKPLSDQRSTKAPAGSCGG